MDTLTNRQFHFARLLFEGKTQSEAYRTAFACKGKSEVAVATAACRLAKNVKVSQLLEEWRKETSGKAVMSRRRRMEWLSARVEGWREGEDVRPPLECLKELNKMEGAYETPKVAIEVLTPEQRQDRVKSILGLQ